MLRRGGSGLQGPAAPWLDNRHQANWSRRSWVSRSSASAWRSSVAPRTTVNRVSSRQRTERNGIRSMESQGEGTCVGPRRGLGG